MPESKFIPSKPSQVSAAKTENVVVQMEFGTDAFPIQHFFNRYSISDIEGGLLLDFGLVDKSGILISLLTALCNNDSIKRSSNIADYFGKFANTHGAFDELVPIPWQAPGGPRKVHSVDFIGLSMLDEVADVDLYYVPVRKVSTVIAAKKAAHAIQATPIASLRSPISTHKLFIKDLLVRIGNP